MEDRVAATEPEPGSRGAVLLTLALAAICALLTLHPVHESDPFWQMTLGRAVLEHGSRVVPEPTALLDFTDPAVAPEWLWGVTTYGLYRVGGWWAVNAFLAAMAALAAASVVRLASRQEPRLPRAAMALVVTLVIVLVASRLRLRPQVAFLAILPWAMLLAQHYAGAVGRARLRPAAALLGLEILWAQIHGSFVLTPAIVGIAAAGSWLRRPNWKEASVHLGFVLLLAAGFLTSAHGTDTFGYVLSHGGGDASLHVEDIHPPSWNSFNPAAGPFAAAYIALWGLALAGALVARRMDLASLGLALLGVALVATANRFFAAGGVLLLPLASQGAAELARAFPRPRGWQTVASVAALMLLLWAGRVIEVRYGPLGVVGPASIHPRAARAHLAGLPEGAGVLSSFNAGGPLGFWLRGRVRTYVDARTPLYFDDADFAVSRDIWTHADALAPALERYSATAVVVERSRPGCVHMLALRGQGWVPAVVEPRFTTFLPRGEASPLVAVAACGEAYITPTACRDGGAQLEAEIARLAELGDSAFLDHLRAVHALRCSGDADLALRLLPPAVAASGWREARLRLSGEIHAVRGDLDTALEELGSSARRGDLGALDILARAAGKSRTHREALRSILDDAVARWSDHTPPDLRASVALLCIQERDADCARFHGIRAAARGSVRAGSALRWLASHHPEPRVQRDALRWLAVLERSDRFAASGVGAESGSEGDAPLPP